MSNFDNIPWIKDILKTHPNLSDELSEPYGKLLGQKESYDELIRIFLKPEIDTIEKQVKTLNDFRVRQILRIAVHEQAKNLPLMKVSDYLTYLAEGIVKVVIEKVWSEMIKQYGTPACVIGDNICDMGFIVVGYGKFGGIETGYSSDLDLVFLHAGTWDETQGGEMCIDSPQFYQKMGQKVLKILGGQTVNGLLYETDMRLRPDGTQGILVQNIESYRKYLLEKAWTWEHQALIRARAILGDPTVIKRFDEIREEVLSLDRDEKKLAKDIIEMREKILNQLEHPGDNNFDLKKGDGGIIDIEFLVQYLTLLHASKNSNLKLWTDVVRLLESMVNAKIIDEDTAKTLTNTYLVYRSHVHKLSLQHKPKIVESDYLSDQRKEVKSIYIKFLLKSDQN